MRIVSGSGPLDYEHLHRMRRCFPMSLLPCHSIASTYTLRCPFLPTDPVPALRWSEEYESLRRIDPTIASSTNSTTFLYTDSTKEGGKKDGFEGASFLFGRCVRKSYYPNRPPCDHSSNLSDLRILSPLRRLRSQSYEDPRPHSPYPSRRRNTSSGRRIPRTC